MAPRIYGVLILSTRISTPNTCSIALVGFGIDSSIEGWPCDFASYSPAAALEWRGYLTLLAVTTLKENGRL